MACINCGNCIQRECNHGFYGSSCNFTCSAQCRTVHCDSCTCAVCNVTSGYCLNGCNSGWYGEKCQQKCPENCSVQNSLSGKCDHGSGTCVNGCVDGFFGSRCTGMCGIKCGNMLCNQTTGDCMTGCVQGFKGAMCNEKEHSSEDDQVAGAIGGAVVIILWGVIVIILICFIRRRRQREYKTFTRNRSLNSGRGSSRRHQSRQHSCSSSSMPPQVNDTDQYYEIFVPEFESYPSSGEARRLFLVRSYSDETAVFHLCTHRDDMDLRSSFRKKCSSLGNRKQFDNRDNPDGRARKIIRPLSSVNDVSRERDVIGPVPLGNDVAKGCDVIRPISSANEAGRVNNATSNVSLDDDANRECDVIVPLLSDNVDSARDFIRPVSCDREITESNEMTEMWNAREFKCPQNHFMDC